MLTLLLPMHALAASTTVDTIDALREAVAAAAPGDELILAPGSYSLDRTLTLAAAGTADAPIVLRGPGATIASVTVEALKISGPHWHVEDLTLQGACVDDSTCEHAVHIVGAADGTWLRGNTLVDFNAQVKANGEEVDGVRVWPDDVRIEGNDLHDTRPRVTGNPVTKLDVVGGRRWNVEANRIADFQKDGGDGVSYAAFLKGHSMDGTFARNLVVCADRFEGGVRVGLSLGGGGTSPDSICEEGSCTPEHARGAIVNNVIAHCNDVGVYLNEAEDSVVHANTLIDTAGIDVRFEASRVALSNNVLDGRIRERDGGSATLGANLAEADLAALFVDPAALDLTLRDGSAILDQGDALASLDEDFCGHPRPADGDGGRLDHGAIEYDDAHPCDASTPHPDADGTEDTGTGGDSDNVDDDAEGAPSEGGCGCASSAGGAAWALAAAGLLLARRRGARG